MYAGQKTFAVVAFSCVLKGVDNIKVNNHDINKATKKLLTKLFVFSFKIIKLPM